jgi:hypothetical protein
MTGEKYSFKFCPEILKSLPLTKGEINHKLIRLKQEKERNVSKNVQIYE